MEIDPRRRKIGIVIAVVLGLLAFIYLSGLVGQLLSGYNIWMAEDGISGNAQMPAINVHPLYCTRYTFSAEGLRGAGLLLIVAGGSVLVYLMYNRFGKGQFDDRNFKRSNRGTYGTAGWMTEKELKEVLEITTPQRATGIILGEKDGKLICLPNKTHLNKHIAVYGASGTMKSRAIVFNYLFQAIRRGESVILTDPKSELYTETSALFRKNGYSVRVFNLVDPAHSDIWNCMADLQGDTLLAQVLTDVVIDNTVDEDDKGDHFWDAGEGNLLKALVLYIDQDVSRKAEQKHLPAVYQLLTQYSERQLMALFDKLPITHPAKAPFNLFKNASDSVRAGIISGLGTRLQVLQNEAIKRITSGTGIDLTLPGKQKCIYYIILSDQDGAMDFLSSLFFSFLFMRLVRYADSRPKRRCDIPVNIVLEELNTMGANPIHDLPKKLSSVRSRNIQVCIVVQNIAQLKNRYPHDRWAEILGNTDTQLMLGCTDELTADFISTRTGDITVEVNSAMMTRRTIAIAQVIPEYRHMEGQGRRRLMTPDEVLRLPGDEMLIIIRGHNVLKARKFDYTRHPLFGQLEPASIYDYYGTGLTNENLVYLDDISEPPQTQYHQEGVPHSKKTVSIPLSRKSKVPSALYGKTKPPNDF